MENEKANIIAAAVAIDELIQKISVSSICTMILKKNVLYFVFRHSIENERCTKLVKIGCFDTGNSEIFQ